MSSIQAYKLKHTKQEGTLVSKGHSATHLPKHPIHESLHQWLHFMSNNQIAFSFFFNLELISISYNYHAATDVGMLGKMCRVPPCLFILLTSVPSCLCAL